MYTFDGNIQNKNASPLPPPQVYLLTNKANQEIVKMEFFVVDRFR